VNRSTPRRPSSARAFVAIGAAALLTLLAVVALLLAGVFVDRGPSHSSDVHASAAVAAGERDHAAASVHGFHQQPSLRARNVAFAVVAVAVAFGAWAFRRVLVVRSGRPRALRISGLPPGRAPPRCRIA
jgi:hypothetical protein